MEQKTATKLYRTNSIKDRDVLNTSGEKVGKLEELVIDPVKGCVAYAVLSFGGMLGMGNKLFAVPWKAMRIDDAHGDVIVNVSKEQLENSEGFDRDNWPSNANEEMFARDVHDQYGYEYEVGR